MAKIRMRKETGKLFFDFKFQGLRCREQTTLPDTKENRAKLESVAKKINAAITLGQFNYADFFPHSTMVQKLAQRAQHIAPHSNQGLPTVKEFKEQWLDEMSPTWRASYVNSVTSIMTSHVLPEFGEKVVSSITKADILKFRAALTKASPATNKSRTATTINKILKIFRLMMYEAAERYNFSNPFTGVKLLKEQKTDIHPLSLDEVNLFLKHVRPDFHNYFKVRFFSGMRSGEVTGLRWEYIDFDRMQILVRETIVQGMVEYTKNDGSYRVVDMTAPLYQALKSQHEATGKHDYVFCNRLGKALDNRNVCNRVWYPMLDLLGLKRRRLYETRHTAATLLIAAGENPEWIARQLGHVDTQMLFKVYSRFVPNLTRRDGSAFENLIQQQKVEKS
ncbi:MAG: site-specific integrase [Candidatus Pacearchaeota archaeon]|nr:site-specific integrase [Candidatus Pacearchaeota archaeon]